MEQENSRLLPVQYLEPRKIDVWAASAPFSAERSHYQLAEGLTLQEMLAIVCPEQIFLTHARVFINDQYIYPQYYHVVRPKVGSLISIRVVPQGGKGIFRAILSIAVIAASSFLASAFAVNLATAFVGVGPPTALQIGIAKAVISAAVGAVGNLLVNSIAPPPKPRLNALSPATGDQSRESPTLFIQGARNNATPFGVIPVVLGTHRFVPPLAAKSYTETAGNLQYSRQLFCWGYGDLELQDIKIGETLLSNFVGVETNHILDGSSDDEVALYPSVVNQEDLNVSITQASGWSRRTTQLNIDEISVDITFAQGLVTFNNSGGRDNRTVEYEIRYSPAGANSWTTQSYTLTLNQSTAVRRSYKFNVTKGQYDVEVRRITADSVSSQVFDAITWTALRSFKYGNPVSKTGLCLTALRIQATDQLNGVVDQLNAIVKQKVLDWDTATQTWIKRVTSNPASIARFILQGLPNATPKLNSEINLTKLQEWHEYCTLRGFEYNGVIDYETSVDSVLREVCAAGRASPTQVDGKYTVVIDQEQTIPVQHVTPRNSWGYEYEKGFPDIPHAFLVEFINKDKGYIRDERPVYDDGYNATNATEFRRMELPGITDTQLVWKLTREYLASLKLRPDLHSFYMDIENLVATRGDLIHFAHDVPLVGLGWGRVKSITTGGYLVGQDGEYLVGQDGEYLIDQEAGIVTAVEVDEELFMEAGKTYCMRFRKSNGTSVVYTVVTVAGWTKTLTFSSSVPSATAPAVGDMFMFGESEREKIDLVIKEIEPGPDYTARVVCQNAAPGIFTASTGAIPDYDSGVTIPPEFYRPNAPVIKHIQTDEAVQVRNLDGSISNRMVISLENTNLEDVSTIVKIKAQGTSSFIDASIISSNSETVVLEGLEIGKIYDIEVYYRRVSSLSLSNNVISLPALATGITFTGTSNPPANVAGFDITVRGDSIYLSWTSNSEIDLSHYEIRFTTETLSPTWDSGIPIQPLQIPAGATSLVVPSAVGSYMIKAVDRGGRYSVSETTVISTITALAGLNFVDEILEHTGGWNGTHVNTVDDAGLLKLDATGLTAGGTYTFESPYDLGAVYTAVITADLVVTGENLSDLIDLWDSIDGREDWNGTNPSQYQVILQIRTTEDDPAGSPTWSSWKTFVIGDYTARGYQFRLLLTSLESQITPVISEAKVSIDMPDRTYADDDILVTSSGITISFPIPFRVAPALGFAIDDMASGDYYEVTNKSASGFDIIFKNSGGTGVERTFSYVAKGFGYEYS